MELGLDIKAQWEQGPVCVLGNTDKSEYWFFIYLFFANATSWFILTSRTKWNKDINNCINTKPDEKYFKITIYFWGDNQQELNFISELYFLLFYWIKSGFCFGHCLLYHICFVKTLNNDHSNKRDILILCLRLKTTWQRTFFLNYIFRQSVTSSLSQFPHISLVKSTKNAWYSVVSQA